MTVCGGFLFWVYSFGCGFGDFFFRFVVDLVSLW